MGGGGGGGGERERERERERVCLPQQSMSCHRVGSASLQGKIIGTCNFVAGIL